MIGSRPDRGARILVSCLALGPATPAGILCFWGSEYRKAGTGQGLMGIAFPETDCGQGSSLMDAILAVEAVTEACPRSADIIKAGNFGPVRALADYGTPHQKKYYLLKYCAIKPR